MARSSSRGDEVEYARQASRSRAAHDDGFGPLFDAPSTPLPLATHDDYQTSMDAADRIAPITGALRLRILAIIRAHPGITDPELERRPEFAGEKWGFSTIRKRRSELLTLGAIRAAGKRENATCWEAC